MCNFSLIGSNIRDEKQFIKNVSCSADDYHRRLHILSILHLNEAWRKIWNVLPQANNIQSERVRLFCIHIDECMCIY